MLACNIQQCRNAKGEAWAHEHIDSRRSIFVAFILHHSSTLGILTLTYAPLRDDGSNYVASL